MMQFDKLLKEGSIRSLTLALTIILPLTLISCEKTGDDDNNPPVIDAPAPDFSLTASDGSNVMLSDFSNKVVVLFFFGNTCPSCKAAAPGIQSSLSAPYSGRSDYMILGLDQWDGNQASVTSFKTITGVSFPLLLKASKVAADYKTTYDRLVVIDKTGNIVFSGSRGAASDVAAVKQKVDMLLAK